MTWDIMEQCIRLCGSVLDTHTYYIVGNNIKDERNIVSVGVGIDVYH